ALLLRDPLVPVDAVLREVQVLGQPLLALPEQVEVLVAEELRVAAVRGLLQRGVGGRLEVLAPGPLGSGPGRSPGLHLAAPLLGFELPGSLTARLAAQPVGPRRGPQTRPEGAFCVIRPR